MECLLLAWSRLETVQVATLLLAPGVSVLSVPPVQAIVFAPSMKVTLPEGCVAPDLPVRVSVKSTAPFTVEGFVPDLRTLVGANLAMVMGVDPEMLPASFVSPL